MLLNAGNYLPTTIHRSLKTFNGGTRSIKFKLTDSVVNSFEKLLSSSSVKKKKKLTNGSEHGEIINNNNHNDDEDNDNNIGTTEEVEGLKSACLLLDQRLSSGGGSSNVLKPTFGINEEHIIIALDNNNNNKNNNNLPSNLREEKERVEKKKISIRSPAVSEATSATNFPDESCCLSASVRFSDKYNVDPEMEETDSAFSSDWNAGSLLEDDGKFLNPSAGCDGAGGSIVQSSRNSECSSDEKYAETAESSSFDFVLSSVAGRRGGGGGGSRTPESVDLECDTAVVATTTVVNNYSSIWSNDYSLPHRATRSNDDPSNQTIDKNIDTSSILFTEIIDEVVKEDYIAMNYPKIFGSNVIEVGAKNLSKISRFSEYDNNNNNNNNKFKIVQKKRRNKLNVPSPLLLNDDDGGGGEEQENIKNNNLAVASRNYQIKEKPTTGSNGSGIVDTLSGGSIITSSGSGIIIDTLKKKPPGITVFCDGGKRDRRYTNSLNVAEYHTKNKNSFDSSSNSVVRITNNNNRMSHDNNDSFDLDSRDYCKSDRSVSNSVVSITNNNDNIMSHRDGSVSNSVVRITDNNNNNIMSHHGGGVSNSVVRNKNNNIMSHRGDGGGGNGEVVEKGEEDDGWNLVVSCNRKKMNSVVGPRSSFNVQETSEKKKKIIIIPEYSKKKNNKTNFSKNDGTVRNDAIGSLKGTKNSDSNYNSSLEASSIEQQNSSPLIIIKEHSKSRSIKSIPVINNSLTDAIVEAKITSRNLVSNHRSLHGSFRKSNSIVVGTEDYIITKLPIECSSSATTNMQQSTFVELAGKIIINKNTSSSYSDNSSSSYDNILIKIEKNNDECFSKNRIDDSLRFKKITGKPDLLLSSSGGENINETDSSRHRNVIDKISSTRKNLQKLLRDRNSDFKEQEDDNNNNNNDNNILSGRITHYVVEEKKEEEEEKIVLRSFGVKDSDRRFDDIRNDSSVEITKSRFHSQPQHKAITTVKEKITISHSAENNQEDSPRFYGRNNSTVENNRSTDHHRRQKIITVNTWSKKLSAEKITVNTMSPILPAEKIMVNTSSKLSAEKITVNTLSPEVQPKTVNTTVSNVIPMKKNKLSPSLLSTATEIPPKNKNSSSSDSNNNGYYSLGCSRGVVSFGLGSGELDPFTCINNKVSDGNCSGLEELTGNGGGKDFFFTAEDAPNNKVSVGNCSRSEELTENSGVKDSGDRCANNYSCEKETEMVSRGVSCLDGRTEGDLVILVGSGVNEIITGGGKDNDGYTVGSSVVDCKGAFDLAKAQRYLNESFQEVLKQNPSF